MKKTDLTGFDGIEIGEKLADDVFQRSLNAVAPKTIFETKGTEVLKKFIDVETGEEIEVIVSTRKVTDSNFSKIWIDDYAKIMVDLGGAKITVFSYIMNNINPYNNQFGGTNKEISEATKVSAPIVNETIQILVKSGFMKKLRVACYIINSNIIARGGHGKRKAMLLEYEKH